MLHDNIDSSLITSEPCKWKLTSYITNKDNASADKATYVKRLKETINPTNSGNVQTKHAYNVIASLDNNKIASDTPIRSGSHQSISIQKEKEVTHHMTVDTEDKKDTPIRSGGHQSKSIQKENEITHHTAVDVKDKTESASDSLIEIVEKPTEDAEAELGQLCRQILQNLEKTYMLWYLIKNGWPRTGPHRSTPSSTHAC